MATRPTARRRPTVRSSRFPGLHRQRQRRPGRLAGHARRRHPLGQAVLHRGLRPVDLRPLDARSPIRWSTRRATTSGPTATRRREGGGTYNPATGRSTTCWTPRATRSTTPSGDPVANLALVRSIFFPTPGQRWQRASRPCCRRRRSSIAAHPADAQYVENVMWEQSRTSLFVHDQPARRLEQRHRRLVRRPDRDARRRTQEVARTAPAPICAGSTSRSRSAGADDVDGGRHRARRPTCGIPRRAPRTRPATSRSCRASRTHTLAFGKPVLMFNGDSHVYQSDNPLSPADPIYVHAPGLRRAELPSHRRPRQHDAARVAEADDRPGPRTRRTAPTPSARSAGPG